MFKDIIETSKWSESHGAENDYLGAGSLYFFIPYMLKARRCVCLGSGAGFVPKLMAKAQMTLFEEGQFSPLEGIFDITLVDANIGPWGLPVYTDGIDGYDGVINLIKDLTDNVYEQFSEIDYLHVDADHSYEQIYKDLSNYGTRMNGNRWAITIHDTFNPSDGDHPPIGSYHASVDWARENGHDIVNFPIGCGTALIMPRVGL